MKIAVTGGMGFIGHELVGNLLKLGHEVIVVDFFSRLIGNYEKAKLPIIDELYRVLPQCSAVVEPWDFLSDFSKYSPQIVVHAGAIVDTKVLGGESSKLFELNIQYTESLTNICSTSGANIIFISSAAIYGNEGRPNNPYGLTKAMGEKIVRRSKSRTASLRLFNVFGRYEHHKGEMASVPWKIAKAYRTGDSFDMFSPEAVRDFVPSSSVVQAVINVANEMMGPGDERWHREFDVGTGNPTSFENLNTAIKVAMGWTQSVVKRVEMPLELAGRYQFFTQAGVNKALNIGGMIGTEAGILEAYGR
jgi:ADP-L-glycero-D-manno-heptose 6-epimerase